MRVYYDRLINAQDKEVVGGMIKNQVDENFKSTLDYVIRDPILFGDYMTALDEGEPRLYQDIQVRVLNCKDIIKGTIRQTSK